MSNWLSGLRRAGLLAVIACAALSVSSSAARAQAFTIKNVTGNSASKASYPAMAVGSDGALNVVWIDSVKGLQFARSTSSGGTALGATVTIQGPKNSVAVPAFQPQIAVYMTQPNVVEIVWASVHPGSNPTTYDVFASRSNDFGAHFTSTASLSGPVALFDSPRLAFDFSGKTNIVWGQHDVLITQAQDGLSFPAATSLLQPGSTPPDTGGPRIAVSVDNHIFVAWTDEQARNQPGSYCTTTPPGTKDPTGTFYINTTGGYFWMNETAPPTTSGGAFNFNGTNTRRLSDTDWNGGKVDPRYPNGFFGCSYDNLRMFTDRSGQVDLLWSGDDEDILISQNHGKNSNNMMSFSFPFNLASHSASSPDVAVDNSGNFYIVWSGGAANASSEGIFFRRFDFATDNFGPEIDVAPSGSAALPSAFPQVAVDSNSNVNIAWEQPTAQINGSDVFNVFFARSTDGGKTFPAATQVTTTTSVLCFKTSPFEGPGLPTTPDFSTCGTVQLGIDASSTPNMVWVNQANGSAVADIDFATSTAPSGAISPSTANLTASNASANFTITVNGFSSPITFSCLDADKNAPLPSWLACSFNPQTLDPAQSKTDTLTLTRQGTPTSSFLVAPPASRSLPNFGRLIAWSMALATICLTAMLMFVTGRRRDLSRALVLRGVVVMTLTIVLAVGLVSCGGSTSSPATGTTGGSGGTGGTGGTGGGNVVTVHVAVQAQSGGTTTTLGTVTITAQ